MVDNRTSCTPRPLPQRSDERGFGIIDTIVGLALMLVGVAGMLAMNSVASTGARRALQTSRASQLASETMEILRGRTVDRLSAQQGPFGEPQTVNGCLYTRRYTVAAVPTNPNLVVVTVFVAYGEPNNPNDLRTTIVQQVRTRQEIL